MLTVQFTVETQAELAEANKVLASAYESFSVKGDVSITGKDDKLTVTAGLDQVDAAASDFLRKELRARTYVPAHARFELI